MNLATYAHRLIDVLVPLIPANTLQPLILIAICGSILSLILCAVLILRLLRFTLFEMFVARYTKPFAALPGHLGEKRLLIVGDSTAVGAGAKKPEDTIAGRLGHDYPGADIVNIGINGALTSDAVRAMESVQGQQFQLVIVSVGGNDIWHHTPLPKLEHSLDELLARAKSVAVGPVILLLYNNIGSSPIFPWIIRRSLKKRGDQVQELFRLVSADAGVPCIELFSSEEANPFMDEPRKYFSPDGVHPSSEGYGLWYNRMWRLLVNQGFTF